MDSKIILNQPITQSLSSGTSVSSITPLSSKSGFKLWTIRLNICLTQAGQWDSTLKRPIDSSLASSIIISTISDSLLDQISKSVSLSAPAIWTYLFSIFVVSDLSSQSAAVNSLIAFTYQGKTMLENKTFLLSIIEDLQNSFSNTSSISFTDLVKLFALVSLPASFQALRSTLEETVTSSNPLTLDSLFVSLIREEASQLSSSSRRTKTTIDPSSSQCPHNRKASSCWSCNPSLRPVCSRCKSLGLKRFHHHSGTKFCPSPEFPSSSNRAILFNVDSGSTDTLVNNRNLVSNCIPLHHPIKTANGSFMVATDSGAIFGPDVQLDRVLVCPEVTENQVILLSLHAEKSTLAKGAQSTLHS